MVDRLDTKGSEYLANLPNELIIQIVEDASLSTGDLAAFCATSSRYAGVVMPVLYEKNIREENANAVLWAILNENIGTLAMFVRHGVHLNSVEPSIHLSQPSPYRWINNLVNLDRDKIRPSAGLNSTTNPQHGETSVAAQHGTGPQPGTNQVSLADLLGHLFGNDARPAHLLWQPLKTFRYTPLALAARTGRTQMVAWLLENGADTEIPAHGLCGCRNELPSPPGLWRVQREWNQVVDTPHWTPLHLATQYGHVDIVRLLVLRGANAHQVCRPGDGRCNALHTAFAHGRMSVIEALLQGTRKGGPMDINSRGHYGMTPLHIAYCSQDTFFVRLALELGAYVNLEYEVDGNQWTLFAMACARRDWGFALELLKLGANPEFELRGLAGGPWTTQRLLRQIEGDFAPSIRAVGNEIRHIRRDQEVARL